MRGGAVAGAVRPRQPAARSGIPCPVPACGSCSCLTGVGLFPIAGWSLGRVGQDRGLWGGGRRGWCEEWARSGAQLLICFCKNK